MTAEERAQEIVDLVNKPSSTVTALTTDQVKVWITQAINAAVEEETAELTQALTCMGAVLKPDGNLEINMQKYHKAHETDKLIEQAIAKEREACAKLCDNRGQFADNCAAAIRERK